MIELLNLALQGDTCTVDSINLKFVVGVAYKVNGEELNIKYESFLRTLTFSEKQLEVIEAGLNKRYSSEKVQTAMKILRAYYNAGTQQQQESDVVNFYERIQFQVHFHFYLPFQFYVSAEFFDVCNKSTNQWLSNRQFNK